MMTTTNLVEVDGVVSRITYHSATSGHTVAKVDIGKREPIAIVGKFAQLECGQNLRLIGEWVNHEKYGPQLHVTRYMELKPSTLVGIEKYLGSGLIKGIGPKMAKLIVDHFGLDTLTIIENAIHRLEEVPGIGQKKIGMISTAYAEQKHLKEVMVFLQSNGVSPAYAIKIYKRYGDEAIAVVSRNPYQLANDISGIGFTQADSIALGLNIPLSSPFRFQAAALYALSEAANDGHCYLPIRHLVGKTEDCLKRHDFTPDRRQIEVVIDSMIAEQKLIAEGDNIFLPRIHRAESGVAEHMLRLLTDDIEVCGARVRSWIDRFMAARNISLSEEQQTAVELAARCRVLILTGGPGTGKTTVSNTICALWQAMGRSIALASPTGRAAQRLSEVTGRPAKTIHRLLEYSGSGGFRRGEGNPIDADAVLVDEVSMLDVFLANSLLKAIGDNSQLLLVGDQDQLPSVSAGNVLSDLIRSEQIPVIQLTQIFRQAQGSQIVMNAHAINKGRQPQMASYWHPEGADCLWIDAESPEDGVKLIQRIVGQDLPQRFGFDPMQDVHVLAPKLKGEVGVCNLNPVMQHLLNPPGSKPELTCFHNTFRLGDRVIQRCNNYDLQVFNGDIGTIDAIDTEEGKVTIRYGDELKEYDRSNLDELALAYAITIHKSQGSQYKAVVIPVFTQHYVMLTKNLIYTGLTRAEKLAIFVGSKKALGMAVRQVRDTRRFTSLAERLI